MFSGFAGSAFAISATGDEAVAAIARLPKGRVEGPVVLEVRKDATVASLAKVLGTLAYAEVPAALLTLAKP